jgi:hypothetical protein
MQKLGFFELADVAKLVGVPQWRAKNWTVGRPLQIRPSLRGGKGRGYLNLYAAADVYLMALAKDLYEAGFGTEAINALIEELGGRSIKEPEKPFMLFVISKTKAKVDFVSSDWLLSHRNQPTANKSVVFTLVWIEELVRRIDRRIEELQRKEK